MLKQSWESLCRSIRRLGRIFTFGNIVLALAAAILVLLAGSVEHTVEKQLNLEERLQLWVTIVIAVVALGAGLLVGIVITKRNARNALRAEVAEKGASELEKDNLEETIRELEAENQVKTRAGAYIAHFQSILDDVLRGDLALTGFPRIKDERLRAAFCELPSKLIESETGKKIALSMWIESKSGLRRGKFDVIFEANHPDSETDGFDFKVKGSYLHQALDHLKEHPDASRLHKMELDGNSDIGDDIAAFRINGYRSLRVVSADFAGKPVRLVALSKQPHDFGELEDKYLLLLWCALEVATRLAAPTTASTLPLEAVNSRLKAPSLHKRD
jgi:hypothetical protein